MVSSVVGGARVSDGGTARWRVVADQPRWVRPGLATLLVATAVLYLWGLRSAGWGNPYYAAAVQSGTKSWKALLFASLDPGNAITVDKPPAAMWVMGLSGRVFGFSSWSMLMPQAMMGVAAVALLYGAVRRCSGPAAGLIAGAALALTPVAALMFRYNNPDALMTLLVVAAAYGVVRAIQSDSGRVLSASNGWLALAGAAIGFAFLAKMMQAFLVLPGLALVVLITAPGGIRSRITGLVTAGVAIVVSAGWYVALVQLWPAGSRPYIGGSTTNSLWELAVDYNGLGRVFGSHSGHGGGAPSHPPAAHAATAAAHAAGPHFGGMAGGQPGVLRLFQDSLATEFAWLLPVAVLGLVAGLWITRRRPRTDPDRAALILWGGWLVSTFAVLAYMSRSFHTYYTIELAPAIAALCGIGIVLLWRRREHRPSRLTLAAMSAVTGIWVFTLLDHTPNWLPWLRWTLLIAGFVAAALLALGAHRARRLGAVIAAVALISGIAGPAAYAVETVALPHGGGSPASGPARSTGVRSGWGGTTTATPQLDALLRGADNRWAAATVGSQQVSSIELNTGASLLAIGGFSGRDNSPTLAQFQQYVAAGDVHYFLLSNRSSQRPGGAQPNDSAQDNAQHGRGGGRSGAGTPGRGMTSTPAASDLNPSGTPESAAGEGNSAPGTSSRSAANTSQYANHGGAASNTSGSQITSWVQAHYAGNTIDGITVYDLTIPQHP
ncbi:ArnT family glycosyltransferase [Nocardia terpenica]|uniref:Phospholipid carrier-dependent glycosyltransferase n=1 Tax=Nocardia terpenica TaxID=455432 RepID=A0A6G9ZBZ7_9NOCA|nr:glycosyltransferase family 39 protein [Nocardia terpenica]QIS22950.1 phospholipid carrier-dependent glycosyltransferase [Nocardia terpenica]